jgi:hypothetical protein
MAETDDDVEALKAERDAALARAKAAEETVSVRERARGVPAPIAAHVVGAMTDEQLATWAEGLARYFEEVQAAARPDRRRGQMLIQNAPFTHAPEPRPGPNGRTD